jgi:hypothetical protein
MEKIKVENRVYKMEWLVELLKKKEIKKMWKNQMPG